MWLDLLLSFLEALLFFNGQDFPPLAALKKKHRETRAPSQPQTRASRDLEVPCVNWAELGSLEALLLLTRKSMECSHNFFFWFQGYIWPNPILLHFQHWLFPEVKKTSCSPLLKRGDKVDSIWRFRGTPLLYRCVVTLWIPFPWTRVLLPSHASSWEVLLRAVLVV